MNKTYLIIIGIIVLVTTLSGCTSSQPTTHNLGTYNIASKGYSDDYAIITLPTNIHTVAINYSNITMGTGYTGSGAVNPPILGTITFTTANFIPKTNEEANPNNMDVSEKIDYKILNLDNNGSKIKDGTMKLEAGGAKSIVIKCSNAKGTFNVTAY
jgi:hypothetical protein